MSHNALACQASSGPGASRQAQGDHPTQRHISCKAIQEREELLALPQPREKGPHRLIASNPQQAEASLGWSCGP